MGDRVWDLKAFQRAYDLSLVLHRATLDWPRIEQYGGIADQLRRSSKAICAMLIEGAGRQPGSNSEFRRYVIMALGSADEARLWCRYAQDLGFADAEIALAWQAELSEIARMLQGLRSHLSET